MLHPPSQTPMPGRPLSLAEQVRIIRKELQSTAPTWDPVTRKAVDAALAAGNSGALERALEGQALLVIQINPEGRVKVQRGPAAAQLVAGRPRAFLMRVDNASGGQQQLKPKGTYVGARNNPFTLKIAKVASLGAELGGLPVEYRLLTVTAQHPGKQELTIGIEAGQGTQDIGFRGEVPVLFTVTGPDPDK